MKLTIESDFDLGYPIIYQIYKSDKRPIPIMDSNFDFKVTGDEIWFGGFNITKRSYQFGEGFKLSDKNIQEIDIERNRLKNFGGVYTCDVIIKQGNSLNDKDEKVIMMVDVTSGHYILYKYHVIYNMEILDTEGSIVKFEMPVSDFIDCGFTNDYRITYGDDNTFHQEIEKLLISNSHP